MANPLSKVFQMGQTPQTEPASPIQQKNNAGGFSFVTGMWGQLTRFLILGSEKGTYYVSEKKLTKENAQNVLACIKADGRKTIDEIVRISLEGRAPKNDYAIFALAMACAFGDIDTKNYGFSKLNAVCRIGTHLFQFVQYISGMRGWGNTLCEGVSNWYLSKSADKLAYQVVKYQSRAIEGEPAWSHDDVLRKCHAKAPEGSDLQQVFRWITEGWVVTEPGRATTQYISKAGSKSSRAERSTYDFTIPDGLKIIEGYELAKHETSASRVAQLIQKYGLTHEMIPTSVKKDPQVWEALLEKMPMTAMIRNLGNMSKAGILGPMSSNERKVREALTSKENLSKARVHPISLLSAYEVYRGGRSLKGGETNVRSMFSYRFTTVNRSNDWVVNQSIVSAVEDAFYMSFDFVEPSNKRHFIGQDVSGSMGVGLPNVAGLTACQASAVLSMVTIKREPNLFYGAFNTGIKPLGITKNMRLAEVMRMIENINGGGTDCSLPMVYALQHKIPVDVFVVYTDNETYAGALHPHEALKRYRQGMGINAKTVVVGMTSTNFTIADPNDPGSLDVAGFDSGVPAVITQFVSQ